MLPKILAQHGYIYNAEWGVCYNPETGDVWKLKVQPLTRVNTWDGGTNIATVISNGTRKQLTHVIFYMMTGQWPTEIVDHIDRDASNIKWNNLRKATAAENSYNREHKPRVVNGEHLEPCVYKSWNKYRVMVGGIVILRTYDLNEANAAAIEARKEWYGEFHPDGGASESDSNQRDPTTGNQNTD